MSSAHLESHLKEKIQTNVHRIAQLARIHLTPQEYEEMEKNLPRVLSWVGQLENVSIDIEEVKSQVARTREDKIEETPLRLDVLEEVPGAPPLLSNAPEKKENFFTVPKVLE